MLDAPATLSSPMLCQAEFFIAGSVFILGGLLALALVVGWFVMLAHAACHENWVWALLIFFVAPIWLVYFFVEFDGTFKRRATRSDIAELRDEIEIEELRRELDDLKRRRDAR